MKLVAIGMLVMIAFVAVPAVGVVGEAAAVECDTYWIGEELYVNACDAVCAVGDRFGWMCIE